MASISIISNRCEVWYGSYASKALYVIDETTYMNLDTQRTFQF